MAGPLKLSGMEMKGLPAAHALEAMGRATPSLTEILTRGENGILITNPSLLQTAGINLATGNLQTAPSGSGVLRTPVNGVFQMPRLLDPNRPLPTLLGQQNSHTSDNSSTNILSALLLKGLKAIPEVLMSAEAGMTGGSAIPASGANAKKSKISAAASEPQDSKTHSTLGPQTKADTTSTPMDHRQMLIEHAKRDIMEGRWHNTPSDIQRSGITDEAGLIALATFAALRDKTLLQGNDRSDEEEYLLSTSILSYRPYGEKAMREVAKIFAAHRDGRTTARHLYDFSLLDYSAEAPDPAALIETAKIAAARDGGGTSWWITHYLIEDQATLIEIAKIAAAQEGGGTTISIANYEIRDQAALIEIARIAAAQDVDFARGTKLDEPSIIDSIQGYKAYGPKARVEIAKVVATRNAKIIPLFIQHLEITDPAELFEIAKIAFKANPTWDTLDVIASRYGLGLPALEAPENYSIQDIIDGGRSFLHVVGLDETMADALYADMRKRDVGVTLLYRLLDLAITNKQELVEAAQRGNTYLSRYLLASIMGFDVALMADIQFSKRALGDFYEQCLALQSRLKTPVFLGIKLPSELFAAKGAIPFLDLMNSLSFLKGFIGSDLGDKSNVLKIVLGLSSTGVDVKVGDYSAFRQFILAHGSLDTGKIDLSSSNILEIKEKIDKISLSLFRSVFKISDNPITVEQIQKLESSWGDLEVFYTLAARFAGILQWQTETAVLGRVVKSVLDGTFNRYKYKGYEGDYDDISATTKQLSTLRDDDARAGWERNYWRIGVYNSGTESGSKGNEVLLKGSKAILNDQVMGHVVESLPSEIDSTQVDPLKEEILKKMGNKQDLKDLLESHKKSPSLIKALFELLSEIKDFDEYQALVGFIRANSAKIGLDQQLTEDVSTLGDSLRYKDKTKEAIVFTTTTNDPKLLLMTGDLVDTSSCQNYRTGGYIQTLLGYVIDANVKLVLSYALTEKDFASKAEYERAKELISTGTHVEYISARQKLKIGSIDVNLPKAYKRRVIKLGKTTEGDAGLVMERSYFQNHPSERMMNAQIREVFAEQAERINAKTDQTITIPASRNPGGIYSDSVGGIQKEAYTIEPKL